MTQTHPRARDREPRGAPGQQWRGRAGQRGAVRIETGEGAKREGAEAGPPEGGAGRGGEGAGEGRRRGGSPRGGDGEESGKQGPVDAGVLTSLRGRRLLAVPVAPSESPAAPRRPRLPSALPRRAGPRPAGRFPPRAPHRSLCKRRPSKGPASLPNRGAYLGACPALTSQRPRKGPEQGWRPRQA